jgi:hypothetical protein
MPFPPNFSGRFIASQKVSYFSGRAINVRSLQVVRLVKVGGGLLAATILLMPG